MDLSAVVVPSAAISAALSWVVDNLILTRDNGADVVVQASYRLSTQQNTESVARAAVMPLTAPQQALFNAIWDAAVARAGQVEGIA